jgi:hypothetical protein
VWLDNFSKTLGRQLPSIQVGAWANCLWTGVALRQCDVGLGISITLVTDQDGQTIPAMPEDPFEYVAQVEAMWTKYRPDLRYSESSMMVRWRVASVPVKPALHNVDDENYRQALRDKACGLDTMYPKELIAENIGALIGFARVMRTHYVDKKQEREGECKRYTVFNVDIKIYEMMVKVYICQGRVMLYGYNSSKSLHYYVHNNANYAAV